MHQSPVDQALGEAGWEPTADTQEGRNSWEMARTENAARGLYIYPQTLAGSIERIADDLSFAAMNRFVKRDYCRGRLHRLLVEVVTMQQAGLTHQEILEVAQTKQELSSDVDLSHILEGK